MCARGHLFIITRDGVQTMNAGGAVLKAGLGVLALYAAWFRLKLWRTAGARSDAPAAKCAPEGDLPSHLQQAASLRARSRGTAAPCPCCGRCAGGRAAGAAFGAGARDAERHDAAAAPRAGAEVFGIVTCEGLEDTVAERCVLSTGEGGKQVVEVTGSAPFVVPANGKLYVAGTLQVSCDVVVARDGELAFGSVRGVGVGREIRLCNHWTRGCAVAGASGVGVTGDEECGRVPADVRVAVDEDCGSVFAGWLPPKPAASGSWTSGLHARFTPDASRAADMGTCSGLLGEPDAPRA